MKEGIWIGKWKGGEGIGNMAENMDRVKGKTDEEKRDEHPFIYPCMY